MRNDVTIAVAMYRQAKAAHERQTGATVFPPFWVWLLVEIGRLSR